MQGVNTVKVWDCALQCYDEKFLREGGADVEGQYASLSFVPFEEAKQNNRSIATSCSSVGGKEQGRRRSAPRRGPPACSSVKCADTSPRPTATTA